MSLKPSEIHFLGQVNQKAFIQKDGKVLLVKYSEDATKHPNILARGKWDMPGGRLNEGESVFEGLKREVFEEIGKEAVIEKPLVTGTFTNLARHKNFFVIYQVSLSDYSEPFHFHDGEVFGVEWVDVAEVLTLPIIYPEYREALKSILL